MRVSQTGSNQVQSAEASAAGKSDKAQKAQKKGEADAAASSGAASGSAKAEISSRAKDMAKAKAAAGDAPDVREEKIAELRKKIAEGKYKVNAEAVADKMVDDHLKTGIG